MREMTLAQRWRLAAATVGVTLVAGACLSLWPAHTLGALLLLAGGAVLTRSPKPLVTLFLTFLVVQDALVIFAGGDTSFFGTVLKRTDEVLVIAYAAGVLIFSRSTHSLFRDRRLMFAIAASYLGVIASSLVQSTALVPAAIDLVLFSKPFLLLAIGASLSPTDLDIRQIRIPALVAMLVVVVFAAVFLAFPQLQDAYIGDFRAPDERLGFISAQGFFNGPGPYSWFCAVTFALSYASYLFYARRAYLVGSFISGAFLILSWRRKSMAGLIVMLLVAVVLRDTGERRRLRAIAALSLAILLAATVLAPYAQDMLSNTVREYGGADPYSNARIALHYTSVLIARDHFPLGAGLASFGSHASRMYYSDIYVRYGLSTVWGLSPNFSAFITDTFWPMVLGEGGVISLAGFCLFLFVIGSAAWRCATSAIVTRDVRFLSTFVLFILVGSLLESTSSSIYDTTMQSALVMIPSGAMLSIAYSTRGLGTAMPQATASP